MTIFQAIILGLIQGLTEFLPVSSSGHLILIPEFFAWPLQSISFDAVIHLATLAAVIFVFRSEIAKISRGLVTFNKKDAWGNLGWMIIVSTIPVVIAGLLFQEQISTTLRRPEVVLASLLIWGIVLLIADSLVKKKPENQVELTGWKRAILIGFAQAIALIPGTSRSGITITAGLFSGLSRQAAAKFAFLLGIPAIAAAGALAILDIVQQGMDLGTWPLVFGFLAAFLSGLAAIKLLLKITSSGRYRGFAVYRIILAIFALFILF
ncbi:undecaprenyl-diphosphatase UppP [Patescibacteria group bacterium]|nr:undecaprenyl-diphosphatase UppP [Patescibacteria group bacterium]